MSETTAPLSQLPIPHPSEEEVRRFLSATRDHEVETVTRLLEAYGDAIVNQHDDNGLTALMFAAGNGWLDCLNMLLDHGAAIDQGDKNDKTALMYAAQWGHLSCLQALLDKKSNIDLDTKDGKTALKYAALRGREACLITLLKHGAQDDETKDSGDNGWSALRWARECDETACQKIIEQWRLHLHQAQVNEETAVFHTGLSTPIKSKTLALQKPNASPRLR